MDLISQTGSDRPNLARFAKVDAIGQVDWIGKQALSPSGTAAGRGGGALVIMRRERAAVKPDPNKFQSGSKFRRQVDLRGQTSEALRDSYRSISIDAWGNHKYRSTPSLNKARCSLLCACLPLCSRWTGRRTASKGISSTTTGNIGLFSSDLPFCKPFGNLLATFGRLVRNMLDAF